MKMHPYLSTVSDAESFANHRAPQLTVAWRKFYRDAYVSITGPIEEQPITEQVSYANYLSRLDAATSEAVKEACRIRIGPAPVVSAGEPGEKPRGVPFRVWVYLDHLANWHPTPSGVRRTIRVPLPWHLHQHPHAGPALRDAFGHWLSASDAWTLASEGRRGFSVATELDAHPAPG